MQCYSYPGRQLKVCCRFPVMEIAEKVVLPLITLFATLLSGWLLAARGNARHRGWGSLGEDLDLADKYAKADLPNQAVVLRRYAAIRLKARIMADSRQRRDPVIMWSAAPLLLIVCLYMWMSALQFGHRHEVFSGSAFAFVGLVFLGIASLVFSMGWRKTFRVPGVSMASLEGTNDAINGLSDELKQLNRTAGDLPDPFRTPGPEDESPMGLISRIRTAFSAWSRR
ncbi:Uncharacterised protein [Mycobacteroides abscessus subsp. abscessus]|nr:Uncharacterised protein [Mycobacteroides abscessus subsp. abscessus]SHS10930.1 Uncharacterised protein [Mycobacteroides abscessus subsp. abscessus]SHS83964.1 Uncharacterised protein [Mycobacteroides abscessus subsp. abscessus]SHT23575.1 Uncharacterised protein [Mycobacteroides abscessus subsp. abscessus]SHW55323.1 Uncharacterised protein [Mycobacteroides abscessus subsp. abscessus]